MVRLREIPRTAAFAWSPGSASPYIATGTRAGAVDADFSNETDLELWDLALDQEGAGPELQPAAKLSTDSGFHDLAWTEFGDSSRGIIAGALENGSLDLWSADKLLSGASDPLVSRASQHSGPVKTLQFNPRHRNLLATGGSKGELFISDLNHIDQPFRLGNVAARSDDIECLDWNKKVPHILVTGSSAGFVTVWDVKTKKESLTLNNLGRKAVSAVAWDPEKPTKLITSIPIETEPLILVWDLRNSNAPERVLRGHESGVLSLSWCAQDPDLLLSSGKDNRTICWNPQTGAQYGEFPVVTNWTFQTRFNPHNPNMFATASFDGKIAVQTLQNTKSDAVTQAGASQAQPLDDEDFFAKAQTQPQVQTFSLPKPPRWMQRPSSVTFGFGGRVISVGLTEPGKPGCRSSKIKISPFEVDESVSNATQTFEEALKVGDLRSICESRINSARNDSDKADWKVIETLISDNPKKQVIEYLGFSSEVDEAADNLSKLGIGKTEGEGDVNGVSEPDSRGPGPRRHKRLSSIFDTQGDGDNFLTDLSASKGAKTNNPFQIYTGSESEADRGITRALLLGDFEKALDICLQEDRMSDAFMIAICGGQKCIDKAREAYFQKQADGPNYLRLLASIVGKNLWDVVHNADLANWKEAIAALCTFASNEEFPDLCETLGDRLDEQAKAQNDKESRKNAAFCFLVSSKLEKVVAIWIDELQENENQSIQEATDDTSFSIHVRALQTLIEKVTVFRQVTKFQDTEKQKPSDWKLSLLYDRYLEYANVAATHGQLDIAEKYLDLLPQAHPEAEVARNRIKLATRKPATKTVPAHATAASRLTPKPLPQPSAPQPMYSPAGPAVTQASNPYAPPAPVQPSNPYAPGAGYTPSGYQPSQPRAAPGPVAPPPTTFGSAVAPPPRASSQSPAVTSYTQATNLPAWNDLPEGFAKAPTPRRSTPSVGAGAISAPFPNAVPPPSQSPQGVSPHQPPPRQRPSMAVPPPPKGPAAPPRMTSPPSVGQPYGFPAPERPPSTTSSAYTPSAPQPPPVPGMTVPHIPRGPSPYNAPPSGPPPSNRYAPNPAANSPTMQPPRPVMAPPPTAPPAAAPGPSPYAYQQPPPPGPYAPPSGPAVGAQPPPPPGSAPGSRPSTAQSQRKASVPPKHPPGDRTHIPPNAQPIYEILSADMQRVKARAPSSFKAQVNDTERRLNILFDHLNNEDLLKPATVESMVELSQALQARNYEVAQAVHLDIFTNRSDECGNWMVGVKRLIGMSRATP
ncbi:protein transporter SEC31 [Helicocarpus griseus UAMH5409]|uniref:Protein transport protein SEC31 n=1 Tax=Helicocarpus griseus UAMH5409 TaxID=1447875 RepID=A0A2B7X569_9EURO|nr:protein transporter SEC31 [Helicocarpus griseus UAMH5409]